MTFLIKGEIKKEHELQPQQVRELVTKQMEMILGLQEQGKVVFSGVVSGKMSGIFIIDAASNEELDKIIMSLPLFNILETEIIPISSMSSRLQAMKDATGH